MITIRTAEVTDIEAIRIIAELNLKANTDEAQLERLMNRVYSHESLERAVESTSSMMIVAVTNNQVIGICNFGAPILDECEDIREIHRLFVHPDYTRQGVGTEFIYSIEDEIDIEACTQAIIVYVDPVDRPRLNFYLVNDFNHEATEDKDGMWYMEKPL